MKKSKKDRLFTAGLILMLLAGLSLLLYPSVSNYLNSVRQAQSILTYDNEVAALRQEDYQRLLVRGVRVAAGAHGSAALPLINEVRSLDMKYVILAVPLALAVVVFLVLTLDKQKRKKKGESADE